MRTHEAKYLNVKFRRFRTCSTARHVEFIANFVHHRSPELASVHGVCAEMYVDCVYSLNIPSVL